MAHWQLAARLGCIALFLAAASNGVFGQEKLATHDSHALDRSISLGELQPTPEMWLYQQELKLYQDPSMAVRRKAEFRAQQRQSRIAAAEWFGYSKSRPLASATPFLDTYSPRWGSNGPDPSVWRGTGSTTTVIVPESRRYSRW